MRDATLFEDAEGDVASGSGPTLFAGDNRQNVTRRAVLAFAVADSLPAGATISAATLWVHVSDAPNDTARTFTLHELLADWGEGASSSAGGGGAPAEPGDATWLHQFWPDDLWSSTGGDFDPATLAQASLGTSGWYGFEGPGLLALVQQWLDEPTTNHGLMLRGPEGVQQGARGFDSREALEPPLRPRLELQYEGGVRVEAQSWSRWKAGVEPPRHPPQR